MRCRHFSLSPNPKKSQRRNETEYKELKMKRNLISQKTQKEKETRVFMCAASRDCVADLTILDTVLVFLACLSLFPSSSLFLHLQLSVSVPVLFPVSVPVSSLPSPISAVSASLDSERLLAFVAVLFNKFYGLSCVKWKWEFMCL